MERLKDTEIYPRAPRRRIVEIVEKYRHILSDSEFELLVGLYECYGNFGVFSKKTDRDVHEVHQQYEAIVKRILPVRNDGRTRRTPLSTSRLQTLLGEYDFTDHERKILEARTHWRNQMLAAVALGMTYQQYRVETSAIREKYDF